MYLLNHPVSINARIIDEKNINPMIYLTLDFQIHLIGRRESIFAILVADFDKLVAATYDRTIEITLLDFHRHLFAKSECIRPLYCWHL